MEETTKELISVYKYKHGTTLYLLSEENINQIEQQVWQKAQKEKEEQFRQLLKEFQFEVPEMLIRKFEEINSDK